MKFAVFSLIGQLVFIAMASPSEQDDWNEFKVTIECSVIIINFELNHKLTKINYKISITHLLIICSRIQIKFSKNYENETEEKLRMDIFLQNKKTINEHNERYGQGLTTYKMGTNKYSDLTDSEFKALRT